MSRYVIGNAKDQFYTGFEVAETIFVPRADDPTRNDAVSKLKPVIGGQSVADAIKFASADDARDCMVHADLQDAKAFNGCRVMQTEFDTDDMSALRAVPA
jgi:hypothetical protein